jgi:hypothetical protein
VIFLIEVVSLLLFVAAAGSQVVWPFVMSQPLFPALRPAVRRREKEAAALRAAERELAEIVEERRRIEALGGRDKE